MILDVDEDVIVEDMQVETEGQTDATCKLINGRNGKDGRQLCR